ncbi:hypothetical protein HELRODRAFT_71753, partial [Helobdella robusta]|uniref:Prefoldin subunit 3 n=1 Tax=Helobdella robusta TaxID=6412 RepID=T1G0R1_HELRO
RLKAQIPELKSSLNIISYLEHLKKSGSTVESHYQLNDSLFSKAKIKPTNSVCLWLGANVMLEYDIDEARELLLKNQETAVKTLSAVDDDLGFIRDQTTTIEVNMARVYNWDVKKRQKDKSS